MPRMVFHGTIWSREKEEAGLEAGRPVRRLGTVQVRAGERQPGQRGGRQEPSSSTSGDGDWQSGETGRAVRGKD